MKKKDRELIEQNIREGIKGYSYCFGVSEEVNKKYLKRFANNRYESALYRGELTVLHLDILESNEIFDTYEGIPNEEIDAELRKFYVKTFEKAMLEILQVRKVEEAELKKKEKQLKEESEGGKTSKGKASTKKTSRKK